MSLFNLYYHHRRRLLVSQRYQKGVKRVRQTYKGPSFKALILKNILAKGFLGFLRFIFTLFHQLPYPQYHWCTIIYAVLLSYGEVTERFVMALDALHTLVYVPTKQYFFCSITTLVTSYALGTLVISRFLAFLRSLRKRPTFNSPGSFGHINSVVPHCVVQSLYTVI
jgi:hypothetical protein